MNNTRLHVYRSLMVSIKMTAMQVDHNHSITNLAQAPICLINISRDNQKR